MTRTSKLASILLLLLTALTAGAALAQTEPPLQVDARVRASGTDNPAALFRRRIPPGDATVRVRVNNQGGGETALVSLRFDYRTDADIALDEIVSRIVVTIEDSEGEERSISTIEPNEINLNPNRVPLLFSTTLYLPEDAAENGYFVRVRIFGNYE